MIIKPKPLIFLISFSFVLLCFTCSEAHQPQTVVGFIFWLSFAVFAFCCMHIAKNEDYYKKYIDDEHIR